MSQNILIFGATSGIAQGAARHWAERGERLYLVARDAAKLETVAADLRARGAKEVFTGLADLDRVEGHAALLAEAVRKLDTIDTVLLAQGVLGKQTEGERDFAATQRVIHTNFVAPVSLLTLLANLFEAQKRGTIAVISSVAGERGRAGSYIYGSTKAGLTHFLSGMRGRLRGSGVKVVTIKPGWVDTPMIAHMKRSPLWASPASVGRGIVKAVDRGCREVYLPGFWRMILFIFRSLPAFVFDRLKV